MDHRTCHKLYQEHCGMKANRLPLAVKRASTRASQAFQADRGAFSCVKTLIGVDGRPLHCERQVTWPPAVVSPDQFMARSMSHYAQTSYILMTNWSSAARPLTDCASAALRPGDAVHSARYESITRPLQRLKLRYRTHFAYVTYDSGVIVHTNHTFFSRKGPPKTDDRERGLPWWAHPLFLFIEMQLIYAGSASAEPVELIFYESVSRGLAYGLRRRLQLTRKDANSPPLLPPPLSPLVLLFFSGQNGTCNEPSFNK